MDNPTLISEIQAFFEKRGIDPMNTLQGHLGMVSDNSVTLEEVDEMDLKLVCRVIRSGELDQCLNEHKIGLTPKAKQVELKL